MQNKPISKTRLNRMITEYNAGATLSHLSIQHQIEVQQLRRALVAAGVSIRKTFRESISKTRLNRMITEYNAGATLSQLSIHHRIEMHGVRQALVAAGVSIRKKGRQKIKESSGRDIEITKLYIDQNQTLQEIGTAFGLTRERVRQILKEQGIESRGRRAASNPEQLDQQEREIAKAYDEGVSPSELRQKYPELTYSTLQSILRKGGVEVKPKGFFNRRDGYEGIVAGIIADYEKGEDTDAIAERYGLCGRTEIYKFLKRAGVDVRKVKNGHDRKRNVRAVVSASA